MKSKFDIVYESIIDDIFKKAEVTYQTNDELKKEVSEKLQSLKDKNDFDGMKIYLQEVYYKTVRVEENEELKKDRIKVLIEACQEVLGSYIALGDVLHGSPMWKERKNEIRKENKKKLS